MAGEDQEPSYGDAVKGKIDSMGMYFRILRVVTTHIIGWIWGLISGFVFSIPALIFILIVIVFLFIDLALKETGKLFYGLYEQGAGGLLKYIWFTMAAYIKLALDMIAAPIKGIVELALLALRGIGSAISAVVLAFNQGDGAILSGRTEILQNLEEKIEEEAKEKKTVEITYTEDQTYETERKEILKKYDKLADMLQYSFRFGKYWEQALAAGMVREQRLENYHQMKTDTLSTGMMKAEDGQTLLQNVSNKAGQIKDFYYWQYVQALSEKEKIEEELAKTIDDEELKKKLRVAKEKLNRIYMDDNLYLALQEDGLDKVSKKVDYVMDLYYKDDQDVYSQMKEGMSDLIEAEIENADNMFNRFVGSNGGFVDMTIDDALNKMIPKAYGGYGYPKQYYTTKTTDSENVLGAQVYTYEESLVMAPEKIKLLKVTNEKAPDGNIVSNMYFRSIDGGREYKVVGIEEISKFFNEKARSGYPDFKDLKIDEQKKIIEVDGDKTTDLTGGKSYEYDYVVIPEGTVIGYFGKNVMSMKEKEKLEQRVSNRTDLTKEENTLIEEAKNSNTYAYIFIELNEDSTNSVFDVEADFIIPKENKYYFRYALSKKERANLVGSRLYGGAVVAEEAGSISEIGPGRIKVGSKEYKDLISYNQKTQELLNSVDPYWNSKYYVFVNGPDIEKDKIIGYVSNNGENKSVAKAIAAYKVVGIKEAGSKITEFELMNVNNPTNRITYKVVSYRDNMESTEITNIPEHMSKILRSSANAKITNGDVIGYALVQEASKDGIGRYLEEVKLNDSDGAIYDIEEAGRDDNGLLKVKIRRIDSSSENTVKEYLSLYAFGPKVTKKLDNVFDPNSSEYKYAYEKWSNTSYKIDDDDDKTLASVKEGEVVGFRGRKVEEIEEGSGQYRFTDLGDDKTSIVSPEDCILTKAGWDNENGWTVELTSLDYERRYTFSKLSTFSNWIQGVLGSKYGISDYGTGHDWRTSGEYYEIDEYRVINKGEVIGKMGDSGSEPIADKEGGKVYGDPSNMPLTASETLRIKKMGYKLFEISEDTSKIDTVSRSSIRKNDDVIQKDGKWYVKRYYMDVENLVGTRGYQIEDVSSYKNAHTKIKGDINDTTVYLNDKLHKEIEYDKCYTVGELSGENIAGVEYSYDESIFNKCTVQILVAAKTTENTLEIDVKDVFGIEKIELYNGDKLLGSLYLGEGEGEKHIKKTYQLTDDLLTATKLKVYSFNGYIGEKNINAAPPSITYAIKKEKNTNTGGNEVSLKLSVKDELGIEKIELYDKNETLLSSTSSDSSIPKSAIEGRTNIENATYLLSGKDRNATKIKVYSKSGHNAMKDITQDYKGPNIVSATKSQINAVANIQGIKQMQLALVVRDISGIDKIELYNGNTQLSVSNSSNSSITFKHGETSVKVKEILNSAEENATKIKVYSVNGEVAEKQLDMNIKEPVIEKAVKTQEVKDNKVVKYLDLSIKDDVGIEEIKLYNGVEELKGIKVENLKEISNKYELDSSNESAMQIKVISESGLYSEKVISLEQYGAPEIVSAYEQQTDGTTNLNLLVNDSFGVAKILFYKDGIHLQGQDISVANDDNKKVENSDKMQYSKQLTLNGEQLQATKIKVISTGGQEADKDIEIKPQIIKAIKAIDGGKKVLRLNIKDSSGIKGIQLYGNGYTSNAQSDISLDGTPKEINGTYEITQEAMKATGIKVISTSGFSAEQEIKMSTNIQIAKKVQKDDKIELQLEVIDEFGIKNIELYKENTLISSIPANGRTHINNALTKSENRPMGEPEYSDTTENEDTEVSNDERTIYNALLTKKEEKATKIKVYSNGGNVVEQAIEMNGPQIITLEREKKDSPVGGKRTYLRMSMKDTFGIEKIELYEGDKKISSYNSGSNSGISIPKAAKEVTNAEYLLGTNEEKITKVKLYSLGGLVEEKEVEIIYGIPEIQVSKEIENSQAKEVTVNYKVTYEAGIEKVEIYEDNRLVRTDNIRNKLEVTGSYKCSLDKEMKIRAYGKNEFIAEEVINAITLPTIGKAQKSIADGKIELTLVAQDEFGIEKIELYGDDDKLLASSQDKGSFITIKSARELKETYVLTGDARRARKVKVYSKSGQQAEKNIGSLYNDLPKIDIAQKSHYNGTINLNLSVKALDGIEKIELYGDDSKLLVSSQDKGSFITIKDANELKETYVLTGDARHARKVKVYSEGGRQAEKDIGSLYNDLPTIDIAQKSYYSGTINLNLSVKAVDGIEKIELYDDGGKLLVSSQDKGSFITINNANELKETYVLTGDARRAKKVKVYSNGGRQTEKNIGSLYNELPIINTAQKSCDNGTIKLNLSVKAVYGIEKIELYIGDELLSDSSLDTSQSIKDVNGQVNIDGEYTLMNDDMYANKVKVYSVCGDIAEKEIDSDASKPTIGKAEKTVSDKDVILHLMAKDEFGINKIEVYEQGRNNINLLDIDPKMDSTSTSYNADGDYNLKDDERYVTKVRVYSASGQVREADIIGPMIPNITGCTRGSDRDGFARLTLKVESKFGIDKIETYDSNGNLLSTNKVIYPGKMEEGYKEQGDEIRAAKAEKNNIQYTTAFFDKAPIKAAKVKVYDIRCGAAEKDIEMADITIDYAAKQVSKQILSLYVQDKYGIEKVELYDENGEKLPSLSIPITEGTKLIDKMYKLSLEDESATKVKVYSLSGRIKEKTIYTGPQIKEAKINVSSGNNYVKILEFSAEDEYGIDQIELYDQDDNKLNYNFSPKKDGDNKEVYEKWTCDKDLDLLKIKVRSTKGFEATKELVLKAPEIKKSDKKIEAVNGRVKTSLVLEVLDRVGIQTIKLYDAEGNLIESNLVPKNVRIDSDRMYELKQEFELEGNCKKATRVEVCNYGGLSSKVDIRFPYSNPQLEVANKIKKQISNTTEKSMLRIIAKDDVGISKIVLYDSNDVEMQLNTELKTNNAKSIDRIYELVGSDVNAKKAVVYSLSGLVSEKQDLETAPEIKYAIKKLQYDNNRVDTVLNIGVTDDIGIKAIKVFDNNNELLEVDGESVTKKEVKLKLTEEQKNATKVVVYSVSGYTSEKQITREYNLPTISVAIMNDEFTYPQVRVVAQDEIGIEKVTLIVGENEECEIYKSDTPQTEISVTKFLTEAGLKDKAKQVKVYGKSNLTATKEITQVSFKPNVITADKVIQYDSIGKRRIKLNVEATDSTGIEQIILFDNGVELGRINANNKTKINEVYTLVNDEISATTLKVYNTNGFYQEKNIACAPNITSAIKREIKDDKGISQLVLTLNVTDNVGIEKIFLYDINNKETELSIDYGATKIDTQYVLGENLISAKQIKVVNKSGLSTTKNINDRTTLNIEDREIVGYKLQPLYIYEGETIAYAKIKDTTTEHSLVTKIKAFTQELDDDLSIYDRYYSTSSNALIKNTIERPAKVTDLMAPLHVDVSIEKFDNLVPANLDTKYSAKIKRITSAEKGDNAIDLKYEVSNHRMTKFECYNSKGELIGTNELVYTPDETMIEKVYYTDPNNRKDEVEQNNKNNLGECRIRANKIADVAQIRAYDSVGSYVNYNFIEILEMTKKLNGAQEDITVKVLKAYDDEVQRIEYYDDSKTLLKTQIISNNEDGEDENKKDVYSTSIYTVAGEVSQIKVYSKEGKVAYLKPEIVGLSVNSNDDTMQLSFVKGMNKLKEIVYYDGYDDKKNKIEVTNVKEDDKISIQSSSDVTIDNAKLNADGKYISKIKPNDGKMVKMIEISDENGLRDTYRYFEIENAVFVSDDKVKLKVSIDPTDSIKKVNYYDEKRKFISENTADIKNKDKSTYEILTPGVAKYVQIYTKNGHVIKSFKIKRSIITDAKIQDNGNGTSTIKVSVIIKNNEAAQIKVYAKDASEPMYTSKLISKDKVGNTHEIYIKNCKTSDIKDIDKLVLEQHEEKGKQKKIELKDTYLVSDSQKAEFLENNKPNLSAKLDDENKLMARGSGISIASLASSSEDSFGEAILTAYSTIKIQGVKKLDNNTLGVKLSSNDSDVKVFYDVVNGGKEEAKYSDKTKSYIINTDGKVVSKIYVQSDGLKVEYKGPEIITAARESTAQGIVINVEAKAKDSAKIGVIRVYNTSGRKIYETVTDGVSKRVNTNIALSGKYLKDAYKIQVIDSSGLANEAIIKDNTIDNCEVKITNVKTMMNQTARTMDIYFEMSEGLKIRDVEIYDKSNTKKSSLSSNDGIKYDMSTNGVIKIDGSIELKDGEYEKKPDISGVRKVVISAEYKNIIENREVKAEYELFGIEKVKEYNGCIYLKVRGEDSIGIGSVEYTLNNGQEKALYKGGDYNVNGEAYNYEIGKEDVKIGVCKIVATDKVSEKIEIKAPEITAEKTKLVTESGGIYNQLNIKAEPDNEFNRISLWCVTKDNPNGYEERVDNFNKNETEIIAKINGTDRLYSIATKVRAYGKNGLMREANIVDNTQGDSLRIRNVEIYKDVYGKEAGYILEIEGDVNKVKNTKLKLLNDNGIEMYYYAGSASFEKKTKSEVEQLTEEERKKVNIPLLTENMDPKYNGKYIIPYYPDLAKIGLIFENGARYNESWYDLIALEGITISEDDSSKSITTTVKVRGALSCGIESFKYRTEGTKSFTTLTNTQPAKTNIETYTIQPSYKSRGYVAQIKIKGNNNLELEYSAPNIEKAMNVSKDKNKLEVAYSIDCPDGVDRIEYWNETGKLGEKKNPELVDIISDISPNATQIKAYSKEGLISVKDIEGSRKDNVLRIESVEKTDDTNIKVLVTEGHNSKLAQLKFYDSDGRIYNSIKGSKDIYKIQANNRVASIEAVAENGTTSTYEGPKVTQAKILREGNEIVLNLTVDVEDERDIIEKIEFYGKDGSKIQNISDSVYVLLETTKGKNIKNAKCVLDKEDVNATKIKVYSKTGLVREEYIEDETIDRGARVVDIKEVTGFLNKLLSLFRWNKYEVKVNNPYVVTEIEKYDSNGKAIDRGETNRLDKAKNTAKIKIDAEYNGRKVTLEYDLAKIELIEKISDKQIRVVVRETDVTTSNKLEYWTQDGKIHDAQKIDDGVYLIPQSNISKVKVSYDNGAFAKKSL